MAFISSSLRLFSICAALCAGAAGREWTNSHGRTFEAEFVKMEGAQVVFVMEGGRQFSTPLLELSPSDQMLIRQGAGKPIESLRTNFGRPWPREVRINGSAACKVVSENAKTGRYIYESAGYNFYSDARITQDALSSFAMMFESTRAYLAQLPLGMMSAESVGARSKILLFGETESYHKSGGPPGSAGCFLPSSRLVLVPMASLGLTKGGTGYSRDINTDNQVLIHELVHQLTPSAYFANGAVGWFSEGLAEYVAVTPYNVGLFRPDPHGNSVKDYVTSYGAGGKGGRNLGTALPAPKLRDFMLMDYRGFSAHNGNLHYGLSLLLTHYFFHMEGDGKATRITAFLKGLREGGHSEAALAPLLGGGSWEKLESEISTAWGRKGVNIRFGG